jgi:hypothetical protein
VDPLTHLLSEPLDEVLDEDRNVFTAFSQWRHLNWENIQSVEQIRSERSGRDCF